MDSVVNLNMVITVAGAISSLGGAWMIIRKIQRDAKKERQVEAASILQAAKQHTNDLEERMNSQLELAKKDLENFKENVDKDLQHLRETYNGEIRNLGQKIEELRSEIRNQHSQMVNLLTKMIDSRD